MNDERDKFVPRKLHKIAERLERSYILVMLDSENWDLEKTATKLHLDTNTLKEKMKQYGITGKDS